MIDFKYLVKVNPSDPALAIKKLGLSVLGNENAFSSVDPDWASKQDFITAVPIAIALTVDMRAVIQANSPSTRFIVTGVTTENVKDLKENFGYKVYTDVTLPAAPSLDVKEEEPGVKTAGQATDGITARYWYNGKEISEEEFKQKTDEFRKNVSATFGKLFDSLL